MSAPAPAGIVETVESGGGRTISWERHGEGPAIIVLHGAGGLGNLYRPLSAALDGFTTLLVDRNGRGLSQPRQPGLETQIEDLAAILAATGAQLLFGHSAGGMLALEAGRRGMFRAIAAYEPGISIEGNFAALPWRAPLYAAMAKNDRARAMAIIVKSLGGLPPLVPLWLLTGIVRATSARQDGQSMLSRLPLLLDDLDLTMALDGPATRFAAVRAPVLLLGGDRSPLFLRGIITRLAGVLPDAEIVEMAGLGHNGPDLEAPGRVAAELRRFFNRHAG